MQNTCERRKFERLPIDLKLEVNHMFKQDHIIIDGLDAELYVFDISKSGIGFFSNIQLPIEYYFNANIRFGVKDYFYAVVKIVRMEKMSDTSYLYGAEFVGLAPFLAEKIDIYKKKMNNNVLEY